MPTRSERLLLRPSLLSQYDGHLLSHLLALAEFIGFVTMDPSCVDRAARRGAWDAAAHDAERDRVKFVSEHRKRIVATHFEEPMR